MTAAERWLPIPDFEGIYEVSDQGRVRSVDRVLVYRNGRKRSLAGKVIYAGRDARGYLRVRLCRNSVHRYAPVHVLVCEIFRGRREPGQEVRHLNGIKTDNRLENLRAGSRSEQRHDDVRNGVHNMASKTHCPQGHPYDEVNTGYVHKKGRINPSRFCRTCQRTRGQANGWWNSRRPDRQVVKRVDNVEFGALTEEAS